MGSADRSLLEGIYDRACRDLDAATLAAGAVVDVPEGSWLMGLGKVARRMVQGALGARPDLRPLVCVGPVGGGEDWEMPGEHPVPGPGSFAAGERLLECARAVDGDPIVMLLSGGGSALAAAPARGLTPEDKIAATRLLLRSGLAIGPMNIVRQRLSRLKGGGLAANAPRSPWHVFALSDVVGDDLGAISSGPCTASGVSPESAAMICRESGIYDALGRRVREILDTPPPSVRHAGEVSARILASAMDLAVSAAAHSPVPVTLLDPINGDLDAVAERYVRWARQVRGPQLLVGAGEPVLRVTGTGKGGRAQHLALLVARGLERAPWTFLAAGSDGRDGDTAHCGACVDEETARMAGPALQRALEHFDSAAFHAQFGTALSQRIPTTHLGELHLLLVR